VRHVACGEDEKFIKKITFGKIEEKKPLVRPRCR
jgi:hypothetical protein